MSKSGNLAPLSSVKTKETWIKTVYICISLLSKNIIILNILGVYFVYLLDLEANLWLLHLLAETCITKWY